MEWVGRRDRGLHACAVVHRDVLLSVEIARVHLPSYSCAIPSRGDAFSFIFVAVWWCALRIDVRVSVCVFPRHACSPCPSSRCVHSVEGWEPMYPPPAIILIFWHCRLDQVSCTPSSIVMLSALLTPLRFRRRKPDLPSTVCICRD